MQKMAKEFELNIKYAGDEKWWRKTNLSEETQHRKPFIICITTHRSLLFFIRKKKQMFFRLGLCVREISIIFCEIFVNWGIVNWKHEKCLKKSS